MPVALQIREVPDEVRDVLADRARSEGRSLQANLLSLILREARLGFATEVRTAELRELLPDEELLAYVWQHRRDVSTYEAPISASPRAIAFRWSRTTCGWPRSGDTARSRRPTRWGLMMEGQQRGEQA